MYNKMDLMSCNTLVRLEENRDQKEFTRQFGKIEDWFSSSGESIDFDYLWTDGEQIYYSKGARQFILDEDTNTFEKWETDQTYSIYRSGLWKDGDNLYYSSGNTQLVWDFLEKKWKEKTWTGLTNFYGSDVWSDGENIYYSSSGSQYVLDRTTSTWSTKSWTGLTSFLGQYIWSDGENIYYSDGSNQCILDKTTSIWSAKSWTRLTSFTGGRVWTNGTSIYYSSDFSQYVLDKETSTWNTKTWDGLTNYNGYRVWSKEDDIYYSTGVEHYQLDKSTLTWNKLFFDDSDNAPTQEIIWRLDDDYYLSSVNRHHYKWDDATTKWVADDDLSFLWANISGRYIWTDGTNYYHSQGADHKKYNPDTNTWDTVQFSGMPQFFAENIWTDGEHIYLYENGQYEFDSDTLTWNPICLVAANGENTTIFYDGEKFHDGTASYTLDEAKNSWIYDTTLTTTATKGRYWYWQDQVYYSSDDVQKKWDAAAKDWVDISWTATTTNSSGESISQTLKIGGGNVWTSNTKVYYQPSTSYAFVWTGEGTEWTKISFASEAPYSGSRVWFDGANGRIDEEDNHFVFDEEKLTWTSQDNVKWPNISNNRIYFNGNYFWSDGENLYYSTSSTQRVLDRESNVWNMKKWKGLVYFDGNQVWTDGESIYYSYNSDQYVLDKTTFTWSKKKWIGLTSFDEYYIWSDGENIYYSIGSTQYILDKSTSVWNQKTWIGLTSFYGCDVWSDGENIYYSDGSTQYILDKATSTWNTKSWTGLTSFYGKYVWSDGENIYYSANSNQYILDKSTSTWNAKTWTGMTSFYGYHIWSKGDNIYYASGSYSIWSLDKSTSTWTANTPLVPAYRLYPFIHDGICYARTTDGNWYTWDKANLSWNLYGTWDNSPANVDQSRAIYARNAVYSFWGKNMYVLPDGSSTWTITTLTAPNYERNKSTNYLIWSKNKVWYCKNNQLSSCYYWDSTNQNWISGSLIGDSYSSWSGGTFWSDGERFYYTSGASPDASSKNYNYWNPGKSTYGTVYFSENRGDINRSNVYTVNNRIFFQGDDGLYELLTKDDTKEMDFYCDDTWLHYLREDVAAVPQNITTEEKMASLLESAQTGAIYQYVGDGGTYANGAYYLISETDGAKTFKKLQ